MLTLKETIERIEDISSGTACLADSCANLHAGNIAHKSTFLAGLTSETHDKVKSLLEELENKQTTEDKELIISWFKSIRDNLDKKFPTRLTEKLDGARGSELDAVNDEIARCDRCIEYIEKFM